MEYTAFLIVAPFAAAVSIAALTYVFRHRREAAARALLWYLALVAGLLVVNSVELFSESERWTLFWARLNHLFYSLIPVAWLAFALVYSGAERVVRSPSYLLFALFPLVTNVLIHTDSLHHLFYRSLEFFQVEGFTTFAATYGPWFWANGMYSYALLLLGAVVLSRAYFGGLSFYRRQSAWIIAGALAPLAFNLTYVFRLFPFLRKDFTPVGFAVAGICFVVAVYRFRLFDVVPVARAVLVDGMDSAVLVIDDDGRVVDINAFARRLLEMDESAIGTRYRDAAPVVDLLAGRDIAVSDRFDKQLGANSNQRHFEVEVLPLSVKTGRTKGTMITIHEVTERVRLLEEQTRLVDELQSALSEIRHLRGIIPICSVCKKIRDDAGYWHQVEAYIAEHSDAEFSHGLCDECAKELYPDFTGE